MNDIPDWAEFTFVVREAVYYGGKEGFILEGYPGMHPWRESNYRWWKEDKDSRDIIRQLEND